MQIKAVEIGEEMEYKKKNKKRSTWQLFILIAAAIIAVGAVLSYSMYVVIQRSFFQAAVAHEMELMCTMESLGSKLIDSRLHDLKAGAENMAEQYSKVLLSGSGEENTKTLSSIDLGEYSVSYCYQTEEGLYGGRQVERDYIEQLDLSEAWEGKTVLIDPDFDEEGNYILTVAAPVWREQEVAGIFIEQMDGYCISKWLGELFLSLEFGTAYIIEGEGRNIATAREENYDWITTRYNAQKLAAESDDEATKGIARLERLGLEGETGIDTYDWNGNKSYVAYGPLTEEKWGIYVGFYGDKFEEYTREITLISSRAAGMILLIFVLFLGAVIAIIMMSLRKERLYNNKLVLQKEEIEQQAFQIAVSEERFRIAMQRSRDIILEYHFETREINCFYNGREIRSGRIGEEGLRKRLIEHCHMDMDSFERFEEVMRAIGRGLTNAECIITGDYGKGKKWYNMSVSAVPNGTQKSTRAVGILRDVTGEHEAELDPLTRLLNKSAVNSYIKAAMQKNLPGTACAFVMLDVDYFKLFNDQYGHPVGDQVLCTIADSLRKCFPNPYLIGRFGGDEFCIYCPVGADGKELKKKLNELSKRVRKIQVEGQKIQDVTLSMGAVVFYGKAEFEKIYKKADDMLYEVKENGRDGSCIFEEKSK